MDFTTRNVARNRCSCCRQEGHNRTTCPHDAATATSLREAYNRTVRSAIRAAREELSERRIARPLIQTRVEISDTEAEFRANVAHQVRNMQERLAALHRTGPPVIAPGPTVRERKIQEILFDNAEMLPNGLYKELMDALVITE